MRCYQTRNPLAVHSPLRSMPLFRPASAVLGMSDQTKAEWVLAIAKRDIPALESRVSALLLRPRICQPHSRPDAPLPPGAGRFGKSNTSPCAAQGGPQGAGGGGAGHAGVRPGGGRLTHCGAAFGLCRHPCRADPGRRRGWELHLFTRA